MSKRYPIELVIESNESHKFSSGDTHMFVMWGRCGKGKEEYFFDKLIEI